MLIKRLFVLAALCVSGLAVARSMPIFGVARFGEASAAFGGIAAPVPFMPLWATILLAFALWVVVLLMRSKEMAMLAFVRILTLIALAAAGPTFAAPITYIVEGTLVYDQNQSSEPDTPGLDGASLELAIIFDPDDPSPITATQANNFYVTEYRPATSASLTLTATAGGSNDGVYVVDPAALVIRNLHTDATNDFIEISMEDFDLNGKDFGDSILQVFFPNQSTPLTTPAPLFEYDASDVDYVTAEFEWGSGEFGFPGEGAAYYDLTNAVSYTAEPDADGDGVPDASDAFPNDASETTDTDGDGVGDNADVFPSDASETTDTDGDGVGDNADVFPSDASETTDTDGDGVGDNADVFPSDASETTDTDGDGVGDNADVFPSDASETTDTDGDGVGDNADVFPSDASETTDTDGDGVGDNADVFPSDASETTDTDGDGVGDNADVFPSDASETTDTDGDGVGDNADVFPSDASETTDTDGDGVGDNADVFPSDASETTDTDGDGVGDNADVFPSDASETTDTDGDGVGDNADVFPSDASETTDTDGDGVGDNADAYPNDASRNALAVPALPLLGLFMLVGLLGLFGLRKLRQ